MMIQLRPLIFEVHVSIKKKIINIKKVVRNLQHVSKYFDLLLNKTVLKAMF